MRKPNKGSIVITKILIKLKKIMNVKWNDEVVMRKATLRPARTRRDLVPSVEHVRGCRLCRGNKDLSQALSEKKSKSQKTLKT